VDLPQFPDLDCLLDLTRHEGVDIRPTLLRVLTDLYVQRPHHMPHEERHYTELALRLIDAVDVPTRAAVARRLASYPGAPLAVLRRLVEDMPETSALPAQLFPHASAGMTDQGKPTLSGKGSPANTAAQRKSIAMPGANLSRAAPTAAELNELFFAASSAERRLILSNLEYAGAPASVPIRPGRASDAVRRLEVSALQNRPGEFVRELEQVLEISREKAQRIVRDTWGEPLLVVARAIDMPGEVLQRILLFVNPAIGHSVDRVYDLSALYEQLKAVSALRLVAIWREMDAQERSPRTYQSLFRNHPEPRPGRTAALQRDHAPREIDGAPRPDRRQRTI